MTSPNEPNWEKRIQELEVEIEQDSKELSTSSQTDTSQSIETGVSLLRQWFESLPTAAKVVVAVVGLMIGFSLLNTVLKLITSLISITILAVVLYLLYKFFLAPKETE